MVWMQISYNLSVITSCIPTIKSVFDSLVGALSGTVIDAPYNLTARPGKSGLTATPLGVDRRSLGAYFAAGADGRLKLSPDIQSQTACYTTADRGLRGKGMSRSGYRSESVRHLTDGSVMVMEEVEIDFESVDRVSVL